MPASHGWLIAQQPRLREFAGGATFIRSHPAKRNNGFASTLPFRHHPATTMFPMKIRQFIQTISAVLALAVAGPLNPLEFSDLRATAEHLGQPAVASGGSLHWIIDGLPELRRTRPGRDSAGKGWIGLVENRASVVTGISQMQLLPAFVFVPAMLLGLMAAWWREGR